MTKNFKKITLSLATSAVLVGNAFALDPAITNFGYVGGNGIPLSIFDASDPTKIKSIAGISNSKATAIDPTGKYFYVTDAQNDNVTKFNALTGAMIGTPVTVGTAPSGITISTDGSKAFVTNFDSNSVSIINTATNAVTATVSVGSAPEGITISTDGSKAFVTNVNSSSVSIINTATNDVTATVSVGSTPAGITLSSDGSKAYVANWNGHSVSVIDTASNSVTNTISVGLSPLGMALSLDGTKLYVANIHSNSVSIIDTNTNAVIQTISDLENANGLSISPDGSMVYVRSNHTDKLFTINTSDNSVTTYTVFGVGSTFNISTFISPNLLTGTLEASSSAELEAKGFTNYVNFAGGTLRATGSFTLSNPIYLHDAFNLTYDDSSTFTTVAGGTVDTNGHDVEFSGEVSGVGGLTKTGTGKLTLSGANSYTGDTALQAGTLYISAETNTSALSVASGTTLQIDANASGTSSAINTTGALNLSGGTLSIIADEGTWSGTTNFTLINSTGGVNGTFSTVNINKHYLVPKVVYEANAIKLEITQEGDSTRVYNNKYIRYDEKALVLNASSGLMWQDDAIGVVLDWNSAITTCNDLTLGGYNDWRLPNYNEIFALVKRDSSSPALASEFSFFANAKYWSSTTNAADTTKAWSIDFASGADNTDDKISEFYVRCVRGAE